MWRDDACLLDILIAARKVQKFTEGVTWDNFRESDLLQNAVMRSLEVIGEAARCVSDETKGQHPEIPWRELVGLRNRLIHEYFRIDVAKVWDAVQNDLPSLILAVEPLVPPQEEES